MTSGRPWADLTHTQAKTEKWCVGGRFQGAKQSRRVRSWEGAVRKAGNRGEQGMSKVRRHPQSRHGRAWGRVAMQAKVPGKAKAVTEGALGEGDFWIQSGMRGQQPSGSSQENQGSGKGSGRRCGTHFMAVGLGGA